MAKYPSLFVGQRWTADLASAGLADLAYKTVTTSRASTVTLTADPDFTWSVEANALYEVFINCQWTGADTGDYQIGFTGPSGAGMIWNSSALSASATLYTNDNVFTGAMGTTVGHGIIAGSPVPLVVTGLLDTAATAGTFSFRWAQGTSNATATNLIAGSYARLTRVG